MVSISFGAGCFHIAYHIGVLEELNRSTNFVNNNTTFHGSSCGSVVAVFAACHLDMYNVFISSLRKVHKIQNLIPILKDVLGKLLPENVHVLCTNRCFIYMTDLETMKPYIVSKFDSKKDVINAVIGSCFFPMITTNEFNYYYKGKSVFDGSIVCMIPDADIKISCIADNLIQYLPIRNKVQSIKNITLCCPFTAKTLIWSIQKGPETYYQNLYDYGKRDTQLLIKQLQR